MLPHSVVWAPVLCTARTYGGHVCVQIWITRGVLYIMSTFSAWGGEAYCCVKPTVSVRSKVCISMTYCSCSSTH